MEIKNWHYYSSSLERQIDWGSETSYVFASQYTHEMPSLENFPKLSKGHLWVATSGSSSQFGAQKWIALSKDAFLASAQSVNNFYACSTEDRWIHALPLFHVGGLSILARAYLSHSSIFRGVDQKWNAHFFVEQAIKYKATITSLVPTQLYDLLEAGLCAPRSLRLALIGGGKLDSCLRQKARDLAWPVVASYGMTETCSMVAAAMETDREEMIILPHAKITVEKNNRLAIAADSLLSGFLFLNENKTWQYQDMTNQKKILSEDCGERQGDVLWIWGRQWEFVKILGEKVHLPLLEQKILSFNILGLKYQNFIILPIADLRRGYRLILVGEFNASLIKLDEINQQLKPFENLSGVYSYTLPRSDLGKIKRRQVYKQLASKL